MSKMTAEVFFHETNDFGDDVGFELVATVKLDSENFSTTYEALDEVFGMIQNRLGSWSRGPVVMGIENYDYNAAITVEKPLTVYEGHEYGHRSMMVGDRIVLDGRMYQVDAFGFSQIAMITIEE